jgi:GntR family transcriptional regulator, arabinose operon transcriptional repressor
MSSLQINIDRNKPLPIYHQIKEQIAEGILTGVLKPGEKLPSESQLVKEHKITHMTVRQAFAKLESEGAIFREQGRGSFVSEPTKVSTMEHLTGTRTIIGAMLLDTESIQTELSLKLLGIEAGCNKNDFNMQIFMTHGKGLQQAENTLLMNLLTSRQVHGVVVMGIIEKDDLIFFNKHNIPYVLCEGKFAVEGVASVSINHKVGLYKVASHLIKAGHRKIALLPGGLGRTDRAITRAADGLIEAYKQAFHDNSLDFDERYITPAPFDKRKTAEVVNNLLSTSERPSAFIINGDFLTGVTLNILKDKGLRAGKDVAIANYADSEESLFSVMRKPNTKTGEISVELLTKILHGENFPDRKVLIDPIINLEILDEQKVLL